MTHSSHEQTHSKIHYKPGGSISIFSAIMLGLVCVVIAHWPVLSSKALSIDDQQYLVDNTLVRTPGWPSVKRFFGEVLRPSTVEGYYQPLSMTSLMLDVASGGSPDNLLPFHRTNLLLHLFNTALLMMILRQLFSSTPAAVLTGLVFAMHPLSVEPLAWISERKTLLATFFALLSIVFYLRHARRGRTTSQVLCLAFYIAALLSKPTTIPLPLVFLLLDYWPLNRLSSRAVIAKTPYFVVAAVMAIITYISQSNTAIAALPGSTSPLRIPLVIAHNIGFYLTQFFWPTQVSGHYLFPPSLSLTQPAMLRGIVLTALLLTGLAFSLRATRSLATGFLMWFVMLLPTMQIVGFTDVIAADKYLYLPAIGAAAALTWFVTRAIRTARPIRRRVVMAAMVVLLLLETVATRAAISKWSDSETLYKHMLAIEPRDARVHSYLALFYSERGLAEEAFKHCEAAMRETPGDDQYPVNVGTALVRIGRGEAATNYFSDALKRFPNSAALNANFAGLLAGLGEVEQAIEHGKRAIELKPNQAEAHNNLGNALLAAGQFEDAVKSYQAAAALRPDLADIHNNLGVAYFQSNHEEDAIREFLEASRLRPDYPDPQRNRALILASMRRLPEAMEACRMALSLEPKNALNHVLMGDLLMDAGRPADARGVYMEALNLSPGLPGAERGLSRAEAELAPGSPQATKPSP